MRSYLLLFSFMLIMSGCTTLQYPRSESVASSTEQELRMKAVESALESKWFQPENEDNLKKAIAEKEKKLTDNYYFPYEKAGFQRDIDNLKTRVERSRFLVANLPKIQNSRIFIDVKGREDVKYVYNYAMRKLLKDKNYTIVSSEKDADYKFDLLTKEDGIDTESFYILFFYMEYTLKANADFYIDITDLRTNKIVFSNSMQGNAFRSRTYILGLIGPINSSK